MHEDKHSIIRDIRSGFFKGVGLAAGFLTTGLFAAAAAMNIFSAGEVISAAKINQNFQIAAPEGAVIAFFLADCPEGWAPADGTNATPDLRGRFVRGRDGSGETRDPDGLRQPGHFQDDRFQGHAHLVYGVVDATLVWRNMGVPGPATEPNNGTDKTSSNAVQSGFGEPRTAVETRPENIALTYCMRKN